MYLTRFGSEVHSGASARFAPRLQDHERSCAFHSKIKPVWDSVVTEVLDIKQDKVTGVRLKNLKTEKETTLDSAGLFVAIGHIPNTQLFRGVIDMNEMGYIIPKTRRGHQRPRRFRRG